MAPHSPADGSSQPNFTLHQASHVFVVVLCSVLFCCRKRGGMQMETETKER